MLQSSSGRKWKKCETTLLFITMHYWGYTSLEVNGLWGLLLPPCLLITAVQQPAIQHRPEPGCGRGMLMTLSASSGKARPRNFFTISTGQADHQVHGGAGRRRDTPFPRHATQEKKRWQPGCLCLQEAHAYRPVSPLRVPSSDPHEERSGEMSPW